MNDPLYGVRPRSSNKDPARHIAILPSYGVQPSTLNLSSAMNVVTFTSNYHANARVFPGAEQGSGFPFLSEPPRGDPRYNTTFNIEIFNSELSYLKVVGDNIAVPLIRSAIAGRTLRTGAQHQRQLQGRRVVRQELTIYALLLCCHGKVKMVLLHALLS